LTKVCVSAYDFIFGHVENIINKKWYL